MRNAFTLWRVVSAAVLLVAVTSVAKTQPLSDAQIKQEIIAQSIANYPGPCACPYNHARNGSACGKRSAWSRAGGYSPVCYADEVSKEMIQQWRERQR